LENVSDHERPDMPACAYIVTPRRPSGILLQSAQRLTFDPLLPFAGVSAAEQQAARTPLVFFLFDAGTDPRRHAPAVGAIRASTHPSIRFAPLICFMRQPGLENIRTCINMGFDDIVTLPFAPAELQRRLRRQVGATCVYYETDSYFGPDRRNRLHDSSHHSGRGSGGSHRRLEILRSVGGGVRILSDDLQVVVD
jgi:CheY-like chemotaxis protein